MASSKGESHNSGQDRLVVWVSGSTLRSCIGYSCGSTPHHSAYNHGNGGKYGLLYGDQHDFSALHEVLDQRIDPTIHQLRIENKR